MNYDQENPLKILVTGGCGFIGSNFIKYLLREHTNCRVLNVDKRTYASAGNNLAHMGLTKDSRLEDLCIDICNAEAIKIIFQSYKPEAVIHFAAESHVDRSIQDSSVFTRSNVLGTHTLLEAAIQYKPKLFLQVSTDEVYGSLALEDPASKETDKLAPRSPYSASKAAAEFLAIAFHHTHGLPVTITRSSNNYGPYQHPEKLIPKFITNLVEGEKVPLMWSDDNPGLNVRDWIHVEDNCRGIFRVIEHELGKGREGGKGEIYNLGGGNEMENIKITRQLLEMFGVGDEMIKRVPHRLGHDFRYALDTAKTRTLGWKPDYDFQKGLEQTVTWYKENKNWWGKLK